MVKKTYRTIETDHEDAIAMEKKRIENSFSSKLKTINEENSKTTRTTQNSNINNWKLRKGNFAKDQKEAINRNRTFYTNEVAHEEALKINKNIEKTIIQKGINAKFGKWGKVAGIAAIGAVGLGVVAMATGNSTGVDKSAEERYRKQQEMETLRRR